MSQESIDQITALLAQLGSDIKEVKTDIADVKTSLSKQVDGLQSSLSELEVRVAATESQQDDMARLTRKVDAMAAQLASHSAGSSSAPPPSTTGSSRIRPRSPTRLPDFSDVPIIDSQSEDLNPQPKSQRLDSPAPPPVRHAHDPAPPRTRLPDPQRTVISEGSVHFTTSIPKITKDLKSFLAFLFPQIFDTPLNIEDLRIRHFSPKKHSDIEFTSKA